MSTRPGRAIGINNVVVYTPDAQMQRTEFNIEYNISLIDSCKYSLYNQITNNYVCYQNQKLNLFENLFDRFELPITNLV